MQKPLIIVESFTKTKTISKYLDNKYIVIASLGHITDLPKTEIGINTDTWLGTYVKTNPKIIDNIRSNVKKADVIYLASDPDTEGEAIAHHIKTQISDILGNKQCYRIKFHEITKKAVTEAISNAGDINQDLVNAQETRRFIDRLVGYKLSPLLWAKSNNNNVSAGRVQSVALLLCVQMLQKIQAHIIEPFWQIIGKYGKHSTKDIIDFKLYDNQSNNLLEITDKDTLYSILNKLDFKMTPDVTIKDSTSSESPSPPYTTTSLQQDAYSRYKMTSKKTMHLAQGLYENGYITYMRTDSTNISNDFKNVLIAYIKNTYGEDQAKFRNYKNKIANAQEAHEAIRITNVSKLTSSLSDDHNKLYDMIWKRTVASQMCNAEYANVEIYLQYTTLPAHSFRHKKSFLIKKGYLVVYNADEVSPQTIQEFKESIQELKPKEYICDATIQQPPTLYNEVALIKTLEKEGIGRPSTYASIIDKLLFKQYVEKGSNPTKEIILKNVVKTKKGIDEVDNKILVGGKNKDLLVPTELGLQIIDYLQQIVPFLLDIHFTAKMENALDKICDKSMTKDDVLADFYNNHLHPVVIAHQGSDTNTATRSRTSGIIKTKYGYCYYSSKKNKYTNIESYLKWRKISADQMTDADIKFVKSLPKHLDDGNTLHLGPYGLYLKDKNNKNLKLDKSKWADFIV